MTSGACTMPRRGLNQKLNQKRKILMLDELLEAAQKAVKVTKITLVKVDKPLFFIEPLPDDTFRITYSAGFEAAINEKKKQEPVSSDAYPASE